MFKTIKYRPEFPEKGFVSIEASRAWMLGLARWYRYNHLDGKLFVKFVAPIPA